MSNLGKTFIVTFEAIMLSHLENAILMSIWCKQCHTKLYDLETEYIDISHASDLEDHIPSICPLCNTTLKQEKLETD